MNQGVSVGDFTLTTSRHASASNWPLIQDCSVQASWAQAFPGRSERIPDVSERRMRLFCVMRSPFMKGYGEMRDVALNCAHPSRERRKLKVLTKQESLKIRVQKGKGKPWVQGIKPLLATARGCLKSPHAALLDRLCSSRTKAYTAVFAYVAPCLRAF